MLPLLTLIASLAGCTSPLAGSLLIVTPRALEDSIKPYADARAQDLPTSIAVLEDILATSDGIDDAEKLKRHLYKLWSDASAPSPRLRYILLVGDADVLPVRYMCLDRCTAPAFNYAFYPSDLYYADLAKPDGSFDDWNAQKEGFHAGYFGEVRGECNKQDPINFDHVDYKPELAVGRWPVSTPEQAAIVAGKSITYAAQTTQRASSSQNEQPPRACLVAVGGWIENRPMMDGMGAALPTTWQIEKRYWKDSGTSDPAPGPDEASIIDVLNQGAALVLHSGHGSDNSWDQSISTNSIARLNNADHLPIVMSAGCSTARLATLPPYEQYIDVNNTIHVGSDHGEVFTAPPPPPACYQVGNCNPTGLGERLLRDGPQGAVAYIGCNTGSQPCGMTLMSAFATQIRARTEAAAIVSSSSAIAPARIFVRLGDCWAGAQSDYYDREHLADLKPDDGWYPPSIFFQGMKFMLYGDPSLPIAQP